MKELTKFMEKKYVSDENMPRSAVFIPMRREFSSHAAVCNLWADASGDIEGMVALGADYARSVIQEADRFLKDALLNEACDIAFKVLWVADKLKVLYSVIKTYEATLRRKMVLGCGEMKLRALHSAVIAEVALFNEFKVTALEHAKKSRDEILAVVNDMKAGDVDTICSDKLIEVVSSAISDQERNATTFIRGAKSVTGLAVASLTKKCELALRMVELLNVMDYITRTLSEISSEVV